MIENSDNLSLEKFLSSYDEILKSLNKEKYILDYTKFDLFYEIKDNDTTVGFITLEDNDSDNNLIINECYIRPDERGKNLFFKSYTDISSNTEKQVFIRKPNKNLINVLLHNDLAFKISDNLIISYADFIVQLKDSYKNSKIKHNYKKVENEKLYFTANLFDLNLSSTLFFDNKHIYSRNYENLCICEARRYDLKKYSIRKKLKRIKPKYIDDLFETLTDNLVDAFDFFKSLNESLSNSDKRKKDFLNENPEFKDRKIDKIHPNHDFIINCPFCDEITQKSAIHCKTCGFNLEKTIIRDMNKDKLFSVEEDPDFYEDSDQLDEIRNMFDSEDEMKDAFKSIIEATSELAFASRELHKEPVRSLNIIDYGCLELNRKNYNKKEEKELNREKSMYALVKYTNEHPTPWMFDYYLESIDYKAFDWIIEKEYITEVKPDEFPELFKDCTVAELIRESESYHDPDTTKEDMIKFFQEFCECSWIVSEKGLKYLKDNPFLDFFTNNLLEFNIYEFKLFADKFKDTLTLEEIGDRYVNAKLNQGLSNNEFDLYLNYVDYYFNLNLSKKEYDAALKFLIQRILYELNTWHLKEYHVAFDEAFTNMTDYLIFKIKKLNIDFDLKGIYDDAFSSLKIEKLKFKYDENYNNVKRLMNGADIFDISGELLDKSQEEGKFKHF